MRYRTFGEADHAALQALDLRTQQHADPDFDRLPEREREGRRHTSLAALKFYERSEHSFVADQDGTLQGFVFAQPVWQGDRPIVLLRTLTLAPGAPEDTAAGLLHAVVKSAYDSAVYEVHFPLTPELRAAATQEGANVLGQYATLHLGSRNSTAPGEALGAAGSGPEA
ncbi:DUF1999 domain-containing protein [Deinococcus hohokamensis]|uniref:DUF1999 domain-containing protein n=1 Tax=Deinococcus hohokamensis TaxID=309883 RepID=A0ABV9IB93_9DEIO